MNCLEWALDLYQKASMPHIIIVHLTMLSHNLISGHTQCIAKMTTVAMVHTSHRWLIVPPNLFQGLTNSQIGYIHTIQLKTTPSIPDFTSENLQQFARLKISLENLLPQDTTEQFKHQILIEHLKVKEALLIADSYSNSPYPYPCTMQSLALALQIIAELMKIPNMLSGDTQTFRRFALRVKALVGMLDQLGDKVSIEFQCNSHVARLMSKLPHDLRANFKRYVHPLRNPIPNLLDFPDWLEFELQVQPTDSKVNLSEPNGRGAPYKEAQWPCKHPQQPTAICYRSVCEQYNIKGTRERNLYQVSVLSILWQQTTLS